MFSICTQFTYYIPTSIQKYRLVCLTCTETIQSLDSYLPDNFFNI